MFTHEEKAVINQSLIDTYDSFMNRVVWAESLEDDYVDSFGCDKAEYVRLTKSQLAAVKSALGKLEFK